MKFLLKIPYLMIVLIAVMQLACKRNKIQKSIAEIPKKEDISLPADSIQVIKKPTVETRKLVINESDFMHLKLKSKIDFTSDVFSQSLPANIHIRKDSVIWISVAVGIEAARASITQDSIHFLDRINKKYYDFSLKEISENFNFEINFNLLQSLLVGNLPIPHSPADSLGFNSLYTSVFQIKNDIKIENQVENLQHKLSTILAEMKDGKSKLGITYSGFTEVNGYVVPSKIFAKIDDLKTGKPKTTTMAIEHAKLDFADHDLRYPYNVPKNYTKGSLDF